jgi:hypothetical protein
VHFFTGGDLAGAKEGSYELTFTADSHATELLEPSGCGDFRFWVEPLRELAQLFC